MKHSKITDYQLERFILDELSPKEKEQVENIIEQDIEIKKKVELMRQENARFLQEYPLPDFLKGKKQEELGPKFLEEESPWKKVRSFCSLRSFALVGMVACSLLLFLFFQEKDVSLLPAEETRLKGSDSISLFIQKNGEVVSILPDTTLQEGDEILPRVTVDSSSFVFLVSLDSKGFMSQHIPYQTSEAVWLEGGESQTAKNAFRLDATPGSEIFVLITSSHKFFLKDVQALLKSVKVKEKQLSPPPSYSDLFRVKTFIVNKQ